MELPKVNKSVRTERPLGLCTVQINRDAEDEHNWLHIYSNILIQKKSSDLIYNMWYVYIYQWLTNGPHILWPSIWSYGEIYEKNYLFIMPFMNMNGYMPSSFQIYVLDLFLISKHICLTIHNSNYVHMQTHVSVILSRITCSTWESNPQLCELIISFT